MQTTFDQLEDLRNWWVDLGEPTREDWRRLYIKIRSIEHPKARLLMALAEHDRNKWRWALSLLEELKEELIDAENERNQPGRTIGSRPGV